jgi:hypothetical protein
MNPMVKRGVCLDMSALGQKRTSVLLDHLVGGQKQAGRDHYVERLRCFEIDDGFELGRRLYRKIA